MDWDEFKKCSLRFAVKYPNGQIREFDNILLFSSHIKEFEKENIKRSYPDPITLLEKSQYGMVVICRKKGEIDPEKIFIKF